ELLAQHDPVKAELVKLRYFAGLSVEEAADLLGISRATADRYWRYAKTWLYCAAWFKRRCFQVTLRTLSGLASGQEGKSASERLNSGRTAGSRASPASAGGFAR